MSYTKSPCLILDLKVSKVLSKFWHLLTLETLSVLWAVSTMLGFSSSTLCSHWPFLWPAVQGGPQHHSFMLQGSRIKFTSTAFTAELLNLNTSVYTLSCVRWLKGSCWCRKQDSLVMVPSVCRHQMSGQFRNADWLIFAKHRLFNWCAAALFSLLKLTVLRSAWLSSALLKGA